MLTDLTTVLPAGQARVPHAPWPPRFASDGTVGGVEQDSPTHVAQRAALLLVLTPGDLIDDVAVGTPEQALRTGGANDDEILAALRDAEPTIAGSLSVGDIRGVRQQVAETLGVPRG